MVSPTLINSIMGILGVLLAIYIGLIWGMQIASKKTPDEQKKLKKDLQIASFVVIILIGIISVLKLTNVIKM